MDTASKAFSDNMGILRAIRKDNRRLHELLERLDRLLGQLAVRYVDPRRLARLMAALRDQLRKHFELEEVFGYFDDAADTVPRLVSQFEFLRAQHAPLFVDICRLAEQSECAAGREPSPRAMRRIAARFRAFHDQLQSHEERETALILETFCDDISRES